MRREDVRFRLPLLSGTNMEGGSRIHTQGNHYLPCRSEQMRRLRSDAHTYTHNMTRETPSGEGVSKLLQQSHDKVCM